MWRNCSKFKVESLAFEVQSSELFLGIKSYILVFNSIALRFSTLFLVLFSLSSIKAQVQTQLYPDVILIGDTASLQIIVSAYTHQTVELPQIKNSLNNFIEVSGTKTDTLIKGNHAKYIQNFTLTCFEPGEFLVNALPIKIDKKIFQSKSLQLTVKDLEVEADAAKMFPIKPIMPEELTLWEKYKKYFWYFVLGLLLAFVIGLIIWLYFKELKNKKYISTPLLPPYEEALDNLRKLDKSKYISSERYYEYYSDLSYILRRYFTRRFEFPANALLTDDLPEAMYQKEYLTRDEKEELHQFLQDADLVKYARNIPTQDKHTNYRKWVEDLIHRTRPLIEDDMPEHMRDEEHEKIRKLDNR